MCSEVALVSEPLCTFLEWDTVFFGHRIYRVNPTRLHSDDLERILSECRKGAAECLYLLADADDAETLRLAEGAGFRRVDTRVTLEWTGAEVSRSTTSAAIRPAQAGDLPALEDIASTVHTDTRFYADDSFSERAPLLYRTWISQSVQGDADVVWVVETDGKPAGYLTCHREEGSEGRIGLVGVGSAAQGEGIGRALVERGLTWFLENGIQRVRVVTQGSNMRAQSLYRRCGFVTASVQLWFHKWFPTGQPSQGA